MWAPLAYLTSGVALLNGLLRCDPVGWRERVSFHVPRHGRLRRGPRQSSEKPCPPQRGRTGACDAPAVGRRVMAPGDRCDAGDARGPRLAPGTPLARAGHLGSEIQPTRADEACQTTTARRTAPVGRSSWF